jgi:hypothetical protein
MDVIEIWALRELKADVDLRLDYAARRLHLLTENILIHFRNKILGLEEPEIEPPNIVPANIIRLRNYRLN